MEPAYDGFRVGRAGMHPEARMGPNPNEQYLRATEQRERRGRIHGRHGQSIGRTGRVVTGSILSILLVGFPAVSLLWFVGVISETRHLTARQRWGARGTKKPPPDQEAAFGSSAEE